MGNLLESVTIPQYPVIAKIKQTMLEAGAIGAMMSGSGPTVFGIFQNEEMARAAMKNIRKGQLARQIYITRPYNV